MSKAGNPCLEHNKELEKALVRIKEKCPEEAGVWVAYLEGRVMDAAEGAWYAEGVRVERFVAMCHFSRTLAKMWRDADGLEPEEGEKPKYDRSIDQ